MPHPGSVWRHAKKGLDYLVIGIGRNVDTMKKQIVYRQLYPFRDGTKGLPNYGLWIRDFDEFTGNIELNGKITKRFTFVCNSYP